MLSVPAFACTTIVTSLPASTTVCFNGKCKIVQHNEFSSGSKSRQEAQLLDSFQKFFDLRLRLTELPMSLSGLQDRGTNPDTPGEYWGDEDGERAVIDLEATHFIDRRCKVESVTKVGNIFNVVITNP